MHVLKEQRVAGKVARVQSPGKSNVFKKNMLVFIDDSGEPGFKLESGSSHFFVIALVIFDDNLEAEKTAVAIKELRRRLRFPDSVEFKFAKSRRRVREEFLHAVAPFAFRIRAIVFEKKLIHSDELRNNKRSFYSYAIKTVLQHSGGTIANAKIKIDGSGDRAFRRAFLTYLRKQLNTHERKIIESCKLVDSKENVLIQLADMIAGSIHRSYLTGKDGKQVYRSILSTHIEGVWDFR